MQLQRRTPKSGLRGRVQQAEAARISDGRVRKVHGNVFRGFTLVEDDQESFARGLAGEKVVVVRDDDVLLLAFAEGRVLAPQLKQALHMGEDLLLLQECDRRR